MEPIELLTRLNQYACLPQFADERESALKLHSVVTGVVHDDDPFYDARMAQFQEFFLFDYRLGSRGHPGSTLFESFLAQQTDPVLARPLSHLRSQRQGLFLTIKGKSRAILVRNLLSGTSGWVCSLGDMLFSGFETGQIFQGRMFYLDSTPMFTGVFLFHPKEVSPILRKHVAEFLAHPLECKGEWVHSWTQEMQRRQQLLASVTRPAGPEGKFRSIDKLNLSRKMATVPRIAASPFLVLASGLAGAHCDPSVPENPFYEYAFLLQHFAFCELKSRRYQHLSPEKIYTEPPPEAHVPGVTQAALPAEVYPPLQTSA